MVAPIQADVYLMLGPKMAFISDTLAKIGYISCRCGLNLMFTVNSHVNHFSITGVVYHHPGWYATKIILELDCS
jgi:hypothetical protein